MDNFSQFIELPLEIKKIITQIHKKCFTAQDTQLTYRTLNHYKKLNIIEADKEKTSSWKKLSAVELIWINIIISLRNLGVNLNKIQILKEQLFDNGKLGSIDRREFLNSPIEYEIALAILRGYDLFLIIFSDFSYSFHDANSLKQWHSKSYKSEGHINLPLTKIIKKVYEQTNKKLKFNVN